MTTTDPLASFGTKKTPQNEAAFGKDQVANNAGGYVFQIGPIEQLRRFLTIGSTGGTFYVNENKLTKENGELILALTKEDSTHRELVDTIVEISLEGRAMKQNPALFALAIACQHGSTPSKQYARKQITKVARTGTHLFILVGYLKQFGGWPRGLRKAVANWYTEKDADKLAYQLVKYRQREGYTHRDVLRLSHPKVEGITSRANIDWAIKGETAENMYDFSRTILGHTQAMKEGADVLDIVSKFNLPWEALPDSAMNDSKVWDKMLDNGVPIRALLRQLPRLTNLGIIDQMGGRTDEIVQQLLNPEALQKSRIHPFNVLVALKTYQQGQGMRSTWTPVTRIVDGLDEMYYASFGNVVPTGKRTMNALDVSGSMGGHGTAGNLPMTAREVSAALAMVTVQTEPNFMTLGFTGGSRGYNYGAYGRSLFGRSYDRDEYDPDALTILPLSKRQRLDDVVASISNLPFGSTDCALPMVHALKQELTIDTFVIYTDNETWVGGIHPFQALKDYRAASGIDAKLIVVSITPTKFSIADPSDKGMLDISGFDSNVPQLISDFSAGRI